MSSIRLSRNAFFMLVTTIAVTGCGSSSDGSSSNLYLLADIEAGIGGYTISGMGDDWLVGINVSGGGDVNGDGISDSILSSGNLPGAVFVVFGKPDTAPLLTTDLFAGIGGFAIVSDLTLGRVAIAGDVNGDGLDDVLVGNTSTGGPSLPGAGTVYIVFGKATTTAVDVTDIAEGFGGFVVKGSTEFAWVGLHVSRAGDVNNDGLDDILVGAPGFETTLPRACYVVFGKTTTTAVDTDDLAAGDVNGDGFDDVILGDERYDFGDGEQSYGAAIVVFGKATTEPIYPNDVIAGIGGYAIVGAFQLERAGDEV